jgi:hypothetical protein
VTTDLKNVLRQEAARLASPSCPRQRSPRTALTRSAAEPAGGFFLLEGLPTRAGNFDAAHVTREGQAGQC